ncbi:MAG: hypothetical protein AAF602_17995 [Myxococcota bacterium]
MIWTLLVSSLAFAGGPKKQLVGEHSAQTLRLGEVMMGTSGVGVGLLPRVHVTTRVTLDAVGLPNGEVKLQLLDRPGLDVSVDTMLLRSTLSGFDTSAYDFGANASLHRGRLSLHSGLHHGAFSMSGLPTESPGLVVQLAGTDPLAEVGDEYTDFVDTSFAWRATTLRGGVELRVLGRSGLLLQGSLALGGQVDIRAATTLEGTTVDIGHALPGVNMIKGSTKPWGSWVASVSWQQVLGPFHLRAGIGTSAIPYAWVTQAFSLQTRIGGVRLKRAHPTGRRFTKEVEPEPEVLTFDDNDAVVEIPDEEFAIAPYDPDAPWYQDPE